MGILKDVDIKVEDGGLGRVASGADALGVVGVGSVAQDGVVLLSSFEDVKKKVGDGPLRDFLEGVYSQVNVSCYARVLSGSISGTVGEVEDGGNNQGVGTVAVSGKPANEYHIQVIIQASGGLNNGTFRVIKNGLKGKEMTIPMDGNHVIPGTGLTLNFSPGSPSGGQQSYVLGDTFVFETTAPKATNGELLAAVDDLTNQSAAYR